MKHPQAHKRILFDLNHPADFHFFKHLFSHLQSQNYTIRVIARNKECLHLLLEEAGISYTSRGWGKHSLVGKYLYAFRILVQLKTVLIRFRPGLTMSLSSPYLVIISRLLGIPCITFDDTDHNPRLLPLIKKSSYLLSPATYPHQFHKYHFHLPVLKELAYLHPQQFIAAEEEREGLFIRLTRTDSVHHSSASKLDGELLIQKMETLSQVHPVFLSSETEPDLSSSNTIQLADPIRIHRDLNTCKVFWGNSATMAAEAAVLGIPAVFVSAEKFAYITELEAYGLLYHFHPEDLEASFARLNDLLAGDPPADQFRESRKKLLSEKLDMTAFMSWFVEFLPESANRLLAEPEYALKFIPGRK